MQSPSLFVFIFTMYNDLGSCDKLYFIFHCELGYVSGFNFFHHFIFRTRYAVFPWPGEHSASHTVKIQVLTKQSYFMIQILITLLEELCSWIGSLIHLSFILLSLCCCIYFFLSPFILTPCIFQNVKQHYLYSIKGNLFICMWKVRIEDILKFTQPISRFQ